MEGAQAVIEATGEYPVYPGHPLTVAWEIMSVYATPSEALAIYQQHGLNCPNAVADNRITGGADEFIADWTQGRRFQWSFVAFRGLVCRVAQDVGLTRAETDALLLEVFMPAGAESLA